MDENDKVCHLFTDFSYNTIVTALETLTNTLTAALVKSRLLDAELNMKNKNSKCSFSAEEHTNLWCFSYGGLGHFISNCPSRNSAPKRERIRCKLNKRGYGQGRPSYISQEQDQGEPTDS
ncbi:hypothetical protein PR048_008379 [Dryococelus australis]|uniref:Uncharacterized protein n=1 Tax=Dryococelus australis TaxID=614101 RepID=A0ABQ9HWX8_9NEOP|nr:hypothetical protein PR048_008379 [Dryococelus australis]